MLSFKKLTSIQGGIWLNGSMFSHSVFGHGNIGIGLGGGNLDSLDNAQ